MSIIIKTKKEVNDDGIVGRLILELEALTKGKLPTLYTRSISKPVFWMQDKAFYTSTSSCKVPKGVSSFGDLCVNRFYAEEVFKRRLSFLRLAGEHLSEVKKFLKDKKNTWEGDETFVI